VGVFICGHRIVVVLTYDSSLYEEEGEAMRDHGLWCIAFASHSPPFITRDPPLGYGTGVLHLLQVGGQNCSGSLERTSKYENLTITFSIWHLFTVEFLELHSCKLTN